METKKNHRVNIVRLGEPRVHSNADSLEIFDIYSAYQVVTKKGNKTMREGFVIRPMKERHVRGLGRLILKVVSNLFLSKDK